MSLTNAELLAIYNAELLLLNAAIAHVYKTGQRYIIGTGASKREFESDINALNDQRRKLIVQINQLDTTVNKTIQTKAGW
jgi:hypothetical protein